MRNVLVTGVPRSGTTLTAALIDSLPDTVCLCEPQWQWQKQIGGTLRIGPDPDGSVFAKWLAGDVLELRQKLLTGVPVPDRRALQGDKPITNYFTFDQQSQKIKTTYRVIPFTRPGLSKDFTLAIKHNGPYLTALKHLLALNFFTIIGIVRNPIDVIHSWRSLTLPVSNGKMHDAARCWPEMEEATRDNLDILERQVRIYDLICQRLYEYRDSIKVLRYEDILTNPDLLRQAIDVPGQIDSTFIGQEQRKISDTDRQLIGDVVRTYGSHYKRFYPDSL